MGKKNIEGNWEMDQILIGFHVNVETQDFRLPDANIDGDYLTLHKK